MSLRDAVEEIVKEMEKEAAREDHTTPLERWVFVAFVRELKTALKASAGEALSFNPFLPGQGDEMTAMAQNRVMIEKAKAEFRSKKVPVEDATDEMMAPVIDGPLVTEGDMAVYAPIAVGMPVGASMFVEGEYVYQLQADGALHYDAAATERARQQREEQR